MSNKSALNQMGIDWLGQIASELDNAARVPDGVEDIPEGTAVITLSDTLAKQISTRLRDIMKQLPSQPNEP